MAISEEAEKTFAQAVYYVEMGRYEQAKDLLLEVLSEEPQDPDSLLLIAVCYSSLGDYDTGYDYCTRAFAAGHETYLWYDIMTNIEMHRHHYAEAERMVLRGLELYSEEVSLISLYAVLMVETGFMKKARRILEDAKRLDPTHERVIACEFLLELYRFRPKGMEDAARTFWEYGSDPIKQHLMIGSAALMRRKFRVAREHLREAFVLDPTDEKTLEMLSDLDQLYHPLCWPNLLFEKFRLPYIFLALFVIAMVSVILFGPASILVVGAAYLALKVYTRFSARLYRFWQTRRGAC